MTDAPKFRSYQDLRVWQQSMALTKQIYIFTSRFPDTERFGLINQMRRAAVAIPSNISEGHSRRGAKEFSHFLSIALGSVAELETQTLISFDLGFLSTHERDQLLSSLSTIGKMIRGLLKSLEPHFVRDSTCSAYGLADDSDVPSLLDITDYEPRASSLEPR
ncbi:MAG TPA: four helix bundle protein [Acidobacteriota bacterium]|nr:four helix bundle protein [Acidobacteriota bacterium]HQM64611.1 four helix bundle protein [Acidobacteriota bacterium]